MWDNCYVHITVITGLSMDHQTERQLAFTATVGAAGTLYVYAIMQKTLVLSGEAVQVGDQAMQIELLEKKIEILEDGLLPPPRRPSL